MARRITEILRKLGQNPPVDPHPTTGERRRYDEFDRDEEETEHDRYRRKQRRLAEMDTSSSLPVKVVDKREQPPPKPGTQFEGPIEKLIEKYKDPREVMRHMTAGQYMRYELRGGQIWEGDRLVYDGTQYMKDE